MAREDTIIRFGAVDGLSPVLDKIGAKLKGLDGAFLAAGAIAAGAFAGLVRGVDSAIDRLDKIDELGQRLGVATDKLSKLQFAADQTGSSGAALANGLTRLNKVLGDAARGNSAAVALFEELGISIRDSEGNLLSADEAYAQVADRISAVGDRSKQASLASAVFGRSLGSELLPNLKGGRAELEAYGDELERLGGVVTPEAAAAAGQFKDNLGQLTIAGQGFFNGLAGELLPALNAFAENAATATKEGGGFAEIGRDLGEVFVDVAGFGVASVAAVQKVGASFAFLVESLTDTAENLPIVGNIAVGVFQTIALAAEGNFAAAARASQIVDKAVLGLATKVKRDLVGAFDAWEDSLQDIDDTAAKRIAALQGIVDGVAKAGKRAAPSLDDTSDSADDTGKAAGNAEPKVKRLAIALDAVGKSGKGAAAGLADALPPIKDIAVELDFTRDRVGTFAGFNASRADEVASAWEDAGQRFDSIFADAFAGNFESFEDILDAAAGASRSFFRDLIQQTQEAGDGLSGFLDRLNRGSMFGPNGQGFSLQGTLGAAGSAFSAYQAYRNGDRLGSILAAAQTGAQIGGAPGAAIAAIVATVANLLNRQKPPGINVIGDDLVGTPGFRNFAPGSTFESRLGGFTFASIDSVDAQARDQLGRELVRFDNEIASLLDDDQLSAVNAALADFNIRLREGSITAENLLGERFAAILATFDQDTQDFVRNAGDLQEQVAALTEVLGRPARLNALLESLEEADRLSGFNAFERELDALQQTFDGARDQAAELGATQAQLARIEELRGSAIERLEQAQRDSLDSLLRDLQLDELPEADRRVAEINDRFDSLRRQAIELGATQADLELIERRRTAALNEQTEATRESTEAIGDFYDMLADTRQRQLDSTAEWLGRLGDATRGIRDFLDGGAGISSLNPAQLFAQGLDRFTGLARRAAVGDFEAIGSLSGSANQLLQQAASFYGVGSAEFQRLESQVRSTLTPIAQAGSADNIATALGRLATVLDRIERLLGNGQSINQEVARAVRDSAASLDRLSRDPSRSY